MKLRPRKTNKYDSTGEYGIGYTNKGEEFYFDLEDYDKIKDYCWHKQSHGYIATNIYNGNNRSFLMLSNLLMDDKMITYKNHNRCDNRKNNLRKVTKSQNGVNQKLGVSNISGCTGVTWYKRVERWRAGIKVNYKSIHLGYFDDLNEAIKTRKLAEEKYFGEYAPTY